MELENTRKIIQRICKKLSELEEDSWICILLLYFIIYSYQQQCQKKRKRRERLKKRELLKKKWFLTNMSLNLLTSQAPSSHKIGPCFSRTIIKWMFSPTTILPFLQDLLPWRDLSRSTLSMVSSTWISLPTPVLMRSSHGSRKS